MKDNLHWMGVSVCICVRMCVRMYVRRTNRRTNSPFIQPEVIIDSIQLISLSTSPFSNSAKNNNCVWSTTFWREKFDILRPIRHHLFVFAQSISLIACFGSEQCQCVCWRVCDVVLYTCFFFLFIVISFNFFALASSLASTLALNVVHEKCKLLRENCIIEVRDLVSRNAQRSQNI